MFPVYSKLGTGFYVAFIVFIGLLSYNLYVCLLQRIVSAKRTHLVILSSVQNQSLSTELNVF